MFDQGGNILYLNSAARRLLPGIETGANLSSIQGISAAGLSEQIDLVFSGHSVTMPVVLVSVADDPKGARHRHLSMQLAPLDTTAGQRMIIAAVFDVTDQEESLRREFLRQTIRAMAPVIGMRDPYTGSHSQSVAYYAMELAKAAGLPPEQIEMLRFAGEAHDFGKVGIPDSILLKPGKLTPEEYEVIKTHAAAGSQVFQGFPMMEQVRRIIRHHHEWWDGTGYPDKLAGNEIPYESQIIAVADAFHAMVSDRPYRKGMSVEKACENLRKGRGTQFNPELVDLFLKKVVPNLSAGIGSNPPPQLGD